MAGRLLILYVLSFLPSFSWSQTDSLRKAFLAEKNDIRRNQLYFELAQSMIEKNLEAAPAFADTLEELGRESGDKKALNLSRFLLAKYHEDKGDSRQALSLYQEVLAFHRSVNDSSEIATTANGIARIYDLLYEADSSIQYYLIALEIHSRLGNHSSVASAYSNIGNLYVHQNLHEKGIEYLKKAVEIRIQIGDEKKLIYTYNNLAVAFGSYRINGSYEMIDSAISYSKKGAELAEKLENHFVAGVIMGGISNLLIKQEKYEEAIIWADRSVIALKAVNRRPNLVFPLINKANSFIKLGRASEALQAAQAGYEIMVETGQQNPLTVYYEVFAEIYEKLGNHREANFWLKKFMALDDSLFQAENVQTMADLEAKYQNQKKETEIANQQLHILEQNNQLLEQKSWIIGLVAGLVLIMGAGFAFFIWYRLKQNAILDRAVIREQQLGLNAVIEAQEMEQRRVARDLHDGIAQELVALDLGLKLVKHQTSLVAPEVSSSIENLSEQLTSTCTEVRNLAHLMLPPTLETQGLIPSLEKLVYNSLGPKGIQVKFEHNDIPVDLNDKVKLGVYRITQELLNNIIKHADARAVWVRVVFEDRVLNLEIEDDGKGFDFEQARKQGSMGIMNILSRVSFLGGDFFSFRRIPRGFVSTISIPL